MNYRKHVQSNVQTIGFLFLFCIVVVLGCSSILPYLDDGESELIQGRFSDNYWSPTTGNTLLTSPFLRGYEGIARVYQFSTDKSRFMHFMHIETLGGPIKNVDIYTRRSDGDVWKLVKQFKGYIHTSTSIALNVRASDIRVVQKTVSTRRQPDDLVIGLKVYAKKQ